jgi:hypothetical protein
VQGQGQATRKGDAPKAIDQGESLYRHQYSASQHTFVMWCHPWDYLPASMCYFEYFCGSTQLILQLNAQIYYS